MIGFINRMLSRFGISEIAVNRDHLSQISWMGWGQALSLILSIASIKLTTSVGPAEYGQFVLVTSLGGLLSLSFFGPLEQGFVRYYFEFSKTDDQRSAYLRSVLQVMKRASFILAACAVAAGLVGILTFGMDPMFVSAAVVLIVISVIVTPFAGLFNAMKLRKEISIIQVLEKSFVVLFLFLAAAFFTMNASVIMTAIVSAMALFLLVRLLLYRRQLGGAPSVELMRSVRTESWKKVLMYGWPFVLWGWLSWFQFNGERWIINSYLTTSDVGKYGLSTSLVNNSIVIVYGVFIQFMTPSIYGKFASEAATERLKGYSLIKIASAGTFLLFTIFGIFLFFGGETVIHLLSTKEYVIDTTLLLLLTLGLGIFYVGQTLALVGFALQRPDAYLVPKILSAVVSVAGYIIGCLSFGLYGIVFAILIGNSIYLISILLVNRRMLSTQS